MSSTSAPVGLWAKYPAINEVKRTLKVVCIGAGASGLLVAYKLQKHFDKLDLTIYEKNQDVSGTWLENRYPGCVNTPANPVSHDNGTDLEQMCVRCACSLLYILL